MGNVGCVRSSAWHWLFSSTHSTSALSGGLRYRPTTSRSFSIKNGSVDNANVCGPSGQTRLIVVIQKIRQLRMQYTEIRLTSRSAVRSLDSSALQPDFRILWKVSIFHRMAYQWSFSMASSREHTGKLVMSFRPVVPYPAAHPALAHAVPPAPTRDSAFACP